MCFKFYTGALLQVIKTSWAPAKEKEHFETVESMVLKDVNHLSDWEQVILNTPSCL